jgi:hypothetical protein
MEAGTPLTATETAPEGLVDLSLQAPRANVAQATQA